MLTQGERLPSLLPFGGATPAVISQILFMFLVVHMDVHICDLPILVSEYS